MREPTIVLVHGAFTDASSWRPVFDRLDAAGHTVLTPSNPLRGLAYDAAYINAVVDELDGPIVLVGHSYAGAVITVAGVSEKVAGLVFVAGLTPDEGESIANLQSFFPSLAMGPVLQARRQPDDSVEVSVDPNQFPEIFAADLPKADSTFLAYSQHPVTAGAFDELAGSAAWRSKPSWAVFGTGDRSVAAKLHRFQYARAGSITTEVEGASHFVMLSAPDTVADVIRQAVAVSSAALVE